MNIKKLELGTRTGHIALTCFVATTIMMLQSGCAVLKSSRSILDQQSSEKKSQVPLTESQVDLKIAFAKAAEARGEHNQALSAYEELAETKMATPYVHHRLALIYDRNGDSTRAEEHYLKSLEQNPADAVVSCDYGYSLYLREAWKAAEDQFQNAIKANPQYMRARVNYGMLLARTERLDEALQQFALGGLSEGAAHHNIALAATENGDTQTATAALERSQQADQGRSSSGNHHALGQVVERIATRR